MKTKINLTGLAAIIVIAGSIVTTFADEEKEVPTTMDKVPQKVRDTLKHYAAESDVKGIEKSHHDGKKVFEFAVEQGAKKYEVAITSKGKFMGTEEDIALTAMPEAVQKTLNTLAAGGPLSGGEKAVDKHGVITYEADLEKDGKKTEVTVDANGKISDEDKD